MARYEKATKELKEFATAILTEFATHKPVLDAKVNIEFLFAFGTRNDNDELVSDAISKGGYRVLGLCRKTNEKERVAGRADVEITIDHDHWEKADEAQQKALLDHELNHIEVVTDEDGQVIRDGAGRPKIRLRKHDVEVGWFKIIAERNTSFSLEVTQARAIFDQHGQAFFPWLATEVEEEPVPR